MNVYPDYNTYFPIIECMEAADQPWASVDACSFGVLGMFELGGV